MKGQNKEIRTESVTIKEGEYISLDGSSGCVYLWEVKKTDVALIGSFEILMKWVDKYKDIAVRTNEIKEMQKPLLNLGQKV